MNLLYSTERPRLQDLQQFLHESSKEFFIPLEQRLDISQYAEKLYENSSFISCWNGKRIVGMICCYTNRPPMGYISNVCVLSTYQGLGIFTRCFNLLTHYCISVGIEEIFLEVSNNNPKAYEIYKHIGFEDDTHKENSMYMKKNLLPK